MSKATITEHVYSDAEIKVDEKAGVIYGVRVLGEQSKNGRVYSEQARKQALALYDGAEVNIDHRTDPDQERGMVEGIGILQAPRMGAGGAIYADLAYLKTHAMAPVIVERALRFPKTFGLSHEAVGELVPGGASDDRDLVESIEHVESVDFVRKPATNDGLFESTRKGKPMKTTIKKVIEAAVKQAPKHTEGARLLKLLESQEMTAVAGAPMDPGAGDADSQIGAAFEQAVVAVLRQDADVATKIAQIKKILAAEEAVAGATSGGTGGGDPAAGDTAVAESVKKLAEQVSTLTKRDTIRTICEEAEVDYRSLSADQRKLLAEQKDEAAIKTIVEGLASAAPPSGPKPQVRRKVTESQDTGSYDDLIKNHRR